MVAVETFKIYNTGVTLYSSFTFTTSMGDTKSFDIPPNSSQYFYVSTTYPVTSPSPDVIVISLGYLGSNFFNFNSTTSSDSFDFYGVGTIFSALTIGDTTYFEKIISDNSAPETIVENTCFELISSGSSVYDYYSTLGWNGYTCPPCSSTYCLSNTGYPTFDDVYFSAGTHNSQLYWTGQTNGLFIYYNTGSTQWCLSTVLNGTCLLAGQSPCFNQCPDLDDDYFFNGVCPTPTPTPTEYCSSLNFSAIFDCDVETPTPTPTPTSTPMATPTPPPTNPCNVVISATIQSVTPTPTPTASPTPTPTPTISRDCTFEQSVVFNTIDDSIVCPYSYEFQSCYDGEFYWTTKLLVTPSNLPLEVGQIYQANVITNEYPNGVVRCIGYRGINNNIIGINDITIISESYGIIDGADCIFCQESIVPDPTPTPTPTTVPIPSECIDCGIEGYAYNKT